MGIGGGIRDVEGGVTSESEMVPRLGSFELLPDSISNPFAQWIPLGPDSFVGLLSTCAVSYDHLTMNTMKLQKTEQGTESVWVNANSGPRHPAVALRNR